MDISLSKAAYRLPLNMAKRLMKKYLMHEGIHYELSEKSRKDRFRRYRPRSLPDGMGEKRRRLMKKISAQSSPPRNYLVFFVFDFFFLSFIPCVFAQSIPSPEEFFGFFVGADYHLIDYQQAVSYWKKLEETSDDC